MSITVAARDLARELGAVRRLLDRMIRIPAYEFVLCELRDEDPGRITITATDGAHMLESRIAATGAADAMLVPLAACHELARSLNGEIVLSRDGTQTQLASAGVLATFATAGDDVRDVLRAAARDEAIKAEYRVANADLARAVRRVRPSALRGDDARYCLRGAQIRAQGRTLQTVATDGYRLAVAEAPLVSSTGDCPGTIAPARTLAALLELAALASAETVVIRIGDKAQWYQMGDDRRLKAIMADGAYPQWERVLPTGELHTYTVDRALLQANVERAMVAASVGREAVRLTFGGARLVVSSDSSEIGSITAEQPIEHGSAHEMSVLFNGRFVRDFCVVVPEADRVTIALRDGKTPCVLSPADDATFRQVIVPLQER